MSANITEQNNKGETMDGLPRQFVSSLRILFDILDENRTGLVRLKDIETRWSDDGVRGLPAGVVDGLRRVSPPDGLLTFDRFVSGLKLVLKRRQGNDLRKPFTSKENRALVNNYNKVLQTDAALHENRYYGNESHLGYTAPKRFNTPHNAALESAYNSTAKKNDKRNNSDSQMTSGRVSEFNKDILGQSSYNRSLREESPSRRENNSSTYTIKADVRNYPSTMGSHHAPSKQTAPLTVYSGTTRAFSRNPHQSDTPPSVPPRTVTGNVGSSEYNASSQMKKSHSGPELQQFLTPPALPPRLHRPNSHILTDLRNWQKEWTANQNYADDEHWGRRQRMVPSGNNDNAIYANLEQYQRKSDDLSKQQSPQKSTVRRHGSGRRHTLSSGIDQNMLKRMRQLEDEKAILESGLAKVDSAREWYLKQLSALGDRQAMLGKVSYNDTSLEAHQERMSFQRARIAEVNQQLQALIESSEKGFPLHMNLAMTSRAADGGNELALIMKNRKLMEDMNHKSSQISQLEKEKATLIRDLFEARSKNKTNHDDTTFM